MKMVLVVGLILFLGFVINISNASAQDSGFDSRKILEEKVKIIKPGVLPNSFFYWADRFGEEIRFIFTVGREKKADYLLGLAAERLAEMKALSEQGITKHVDKLLSEHDTSVKSAEKMLLKLKEDGIKKGKELQIDTEKEIYRQEIAVKKEAAQAPAKYKEGRDSAVNNVLAWFKGLLRHLGGKKTDIEQQRAEMSE